MQQPLESNVNIIVRDSLHFQDQNSVASTTSAPRTNLRGQQDRLIIDCTSTRFTISLFASLLVLTVSSFAICNFLPQAFSVKQNSDGKCPNPTIVEGNGSIQCSDFNLKANPIRGIIIKGLSEDNQYVITNSKFYLVDPAIPTTLKGQIKFSQYQVNSDQEETAEALENGVESKEVDYEVDSSSKSDKVYNDQVSLLGLKHKLFYQHQILSANQLFIVDFLNISQNTNINNVTIEVLFITPSFTKFSVGLRVAFFVLSLFACGLYCVRVRLIQRTNMVLEHKLILVLSIGLVLFNNPLVMLAFKGNSNFLVFFTQLTSILLPVTLLFFWICAFERGDAPNILQRSRVLRQPFKWIIVATILALQLATLLFKAYHHQIDYVGGPDPDPPFVDVLENVSVVIEVVCVIYISIKAVNIFRHQGTLPRDKVLVAVSVFFVSFMAVFLFTDSFYIYSVGPTSIFLVNVQMNVYVYYLQVLYQPQLSRNPDQPSPGIEILEVPNKLVTQTKVIQLTGKTGGNQLELPKLSIIMERSAEQSVGRFGEDQVLHVYPLKEEKQLQDLENFDIGEPEVVRRLPSQIQQIPEENSEEEMPSEELDTDKDMNSSLLEQRGTD